MNKTYTDNQGNKYRRAGGGWEIMRKGIGWKAFESTAYTHVYSEEEDAIETLVIEPTPQPEPPEVADEKQLRKAREDELFVHFAGVSLRELIVGGGHELDVASTSCDYAQAMIDELKDRGRL